MTDTMPNTKKYGFVILHYVAYEMTVECVFLLLKNFGCYDIHIAVVDNASKNKSGQKLADLYENEDKVTVLLYEENAGFARGNNLGYDYLKDHEKTAWHSHCSSRDGKNQRRPKRNPALYPAAQWPVPGKADSVLRGEVERKMIERYRYRI